MMQNGGEGGGGGGMVGKQAGKLALQAMECGGVTAAAAAQLQRNELKPLIGSKREKISDEGECTVLAEH